MANAAQMVLEATGLLPHVNAGALYAYELDQLRGVAASQGMMLETLADVPAHRLAPDKAPARRLATLELAGELAIPFTTGLLVGIGEDREDRLETIRAIAAAHERHGHVQEVIVQNFRPKPRTAMASSPAPSDEEFHWTIAAARLLLPPEVHVQAPPNLSDDPARLLAFGIDDFGGISAVTLRPREPRRAWPAVETLAAEAAPYGVHLAARLTVYPSFIAGREIPRRPRAARGAGHADATGLARDDVWYSGSDAAPPAPSRSACAPVRCARCSRATRRERSSPPASW